MSVLIDKLLKEVDTSITAQMALQYTDIKKQRTIPSFNSQSEVLESYNNAASSDNNLTGWFWVGSFDTSGGEWVHMASVNGVIHINGVPAGTKK